MTVISDWVENTSEENGEYVSPSLNKAGFFATLIVVFLCWFLVSRLRWSAPGRAGQGSAGQGRAGQGRAGQSIEVTNT